MLYLYPKNAVDFTNNGDPIRHSFDEHVIRDDGFYLTFNLLLDKEEEYKKVKKEMIVAAETPDGRNQFRVYDVKKKSTQVEIIAVQLMYDFDNKEVNPFSLKNASGAQIINRFKSSFKSTLGQFTMDSSVTESHDFTTNEEEDDTPSHNALEILNRITKRWDNELMLNGFDIRMIKRLGAKTDALLYEKKNISEFEDASSVSGMATRIHATSKFTPEGKEDEVILSVTVDSPLINEYAQIYEKSYVNNDAKTEAELIAWVKLKYSTENIDKPSRTITVETNIIDGTEINYGDDLVMKYLVHDVDEVIRCVGYDYDPIKNTYYSVTLGDWKDSFATTLTGGIVDTTNRKFNQIKNNITYISMSANGKNRNAYGPEPVPNPINGDNWYYYEFDRPDDVEYRVYQDGFWVKLDFFAAKKEVTEALDKADEAKQEAIDSYNKSITDAKAYTEQKANEFNNQLEIVRADVADTVIKANSAVAKADQAIKDAGFSQADASSAKTNATNALTAANAAKVDSASALTKANTAITDSSKALTNANSALTRVGAVEVTTGSLTTSYDALTKAVALKADQTTVDGINGKVTTQGLAITANATAIGLKADKTLVDTINSTVSKHTTDIKATADGLKLKADSSVVNTLSGTVTTHTTQIKAASDGLALKADSSLVNTIKGTVDTHTTQIKATSDGLALKADSTLVNTIKGTVDTHSTQISANSQAITARLTSAQVETILTGKKYVNETTLAATSTAITAQITQVSTDLSNLEIGGTNLVYNSEIPPFSPINYNGGTYVVSKVLENVPFLNVSTVTEVSRTVGGGDFRPPDITIDDGRNREYTVSVWVRPVSPSVSLTLTLGVNDKEMTGKTVVLTDATKWMRVTYSKKFSANIDGTLLRVYLNLGENQKARFSKIKLEKGIKATDWSPSPNDMATLEKVVTIEANIDGINTLVASKASQTQVTQLAGQIQTKVESAAYNTKMTQLDSAINLRVTATNVTAAILADKTIKDTRADNQLPSWYNTNYPKQTVEEFKQRTTMGIAGTATYGKLETKVIWNSTSGGAITQIFSSSDGVFQRVSNAAYTAWEAWDKIAEAGQLISQINLSTEGILLQGKRIQLDGDVAMNAAFITRLDTQTLNAVTANIATIRTKMLTADVILSTMIKSDTALVTKIFATDANVSILTAKTAFINSVKAIDIAADRITAGTLNAAKVTIINLDASRITTGTLSGANYALNLNTGSETFRNPSNGNTLLIQQDKFYFDTNSASHYLIPDNEGFALVPGTGNTGNNRNAGIRLKSTNFNYLDLGLGADGGFQYRIGGYANNFAFMSKNSGDFVFSHTAIGDSNVGSHMWKLQDGNYGTLNYGKTNLVINGYDGSVVPKVSVFNPANGQLATFDTQFLNLTGPTGTIELSQAGGSFKITHGVNRNWVFAQGNNGTVTYGTTMIALNGHNNASARLSVYGAGGSSYGYMSAANFDVQSERKYKDNITDFGSALSIISTMKIRQYDKNGISEIGIITDEAPLQLLADNDTKVSLYDYASLAVRGVQELGDLTWNHEVKLSKHELRIKELEEKIKKMESAA